jgi:hypothetical protein
VKSEIRSRRPRQSLKNFARFARSSFFTALGLTPAQTRAIGFILWTPFILPGEAPPSTRQDFAALAPNPARRLRIIINGLNVWTIVAYIANTYFLPRHFLTVTREYAIYIRPINS